jgi:hypothetical protein
MELLQPLGWWALLGAPVIVALYFLRQRRPPQVVGSLLLWSMARRDALRGRPWDRFRPSLLLWLQLLVLLGLTAALLRPACVSEQVRAARVVLVLDASGSMAATDEAPTRWGAALARAAQTIEATPEGAEVGIIAAGRVTRVVSPLTRDRRALARALEALAARGPDATRGDLREALLLAAELGGASEGRQLVLFSDGAFDQAQLPQTLSAGASYVALGRRAENLAITALELRRAANQRFGASLLCVVTNTGPVAMEGHLEISADGRALEQARIALEPGASRALSVPLAMDEAVLVARLSDARGPGDARDWLPLDDEATAALAPERPLRVRLEGANPLLERALRLNPRLALEVAGESAPAEPADVTIYDGVFPQEIPSGRFLAIAPQGENPLVRWGAVTRGPQVASWDQGHPALHHVELGRVRFGEVAAATPLAPLVPLAEFAGEAGPLLLSGQTPTWRGLVWTVPLLESDLPLRVGFPVWLYNALGWLQPGGDRNLGLTVAAGEALAIRAVARDQVRLRGPGGLSWEKELGEGDTDGVVLYSETGRPGLYEVEVRSPGQAARAQRFGVSMSDEGESGIAPLARLQLPQGAAVEGAEAVAQVEERAELALLAVLLLAALEWALYLWRARRGGVA